MSRAFGPSPRNARSNRASWRSHALRSPVTVTPPSRPVSGESANDTGCSAPGATVTVRDAGA